MIRKVQILILIVNMVQDVRLLLWEDLFLLQRINNHLKYKLRKLF